MVSFFPSSWITKQNQQSPNTRKWWNNVEARGGKHHTSQVDRQGLVKSSTCKAETRIGKTGIIRSTRESIEEKKKKKKTQHKEDKPTDCHYWERINPSWVNQGEEGKTQTPGQPTDITDDTHQVIRDESLERQRKMQTII